MSPMSCLLQGEMAEAFDVWRKGRDDLGEELADVAIYLLGPGRVASWNKAGARFRDCSRNRAPSFLTEPVVFLSAPRALCVSCYQAALRVPRPRRSVRTHRRLWRSRGC